MLLRGNGAQWRATVPTRARTTTRRKLHDQAGAMLAGLFLQPRDWVGVQDGLDAIAADMGVDDGSACPKFIMRVLHLF